MSEVLSLLVVLFFFCLSQIIKLKLMLNVKYNKNFCVFFLRIKGTLFNKMINCKNAAPNIGYQL